MRNVFGTAALAALFVAGALAAPSGKGFVLKRQPHLGDSALYQISASFKYGDKTATMSMEQTETVKKIDTDGTFRIEASASNCKFCVADKERALPDDQPVASTYDSGGAVTTIESTADVNAYRKANMIAVTAPPNAVNVGDKWDRMVAGDSSKGIAAAKANFEIVALEKVGALHTAKVKFNFAETEGNDPISSEGFAWLNTEDGSVVNVEVSFKNFPLGDANVPVQGTFSMKREK
jgi:hypothetical protein